MKELVSTTGGRYLFFDDLSDLQHSALASAEALYFGHGDFVISGCKMSGNNLSAGYVFLDGKIREVPAATNLSLPVYIVPQNTTTMGTYLDSTTLKEASVNYGVRISNQPGSGSYILVSGSTPALTIGDILLSTARSSGSLTVDELSVGNSLAIGSVELEAIGGGLSISGNISANNASFLQNVTAKRVNANLQVVVSDDNNSITVSTTSISSSRGTSLIFSSNEINTSGMFSSSNGFKTGSVTYDKNGIMYNSTGIFTWSVSGARTVRTEFGVVVAGIGSATPSLSIQTESTPGAIPTYQNILTDASMLCHSPSTGQYPNNVSGLDMTGGKAQLYIHGHRYDLAVSATGFLYDANNPEFVDPTSGGGSGGGSVTPSAITQLDDIEVINFKKSTGSSTFTGVLGLNNSGILSYDGPIQLGGGILMSGGSSIAGADSIQVSRVYTGMIHILDSNQYVQGKAGTTTITAYNNIRFVVTQGASASSRIVKLVADRVVQTFVGGILISVVTNTGQVLTGFTTPHPVDVVTQ